MYARLQLRNTVISLSSTLKCGNTKVCQHFTNKTCRNNQFARHVIKLANHCYFNKTNNSFLHCSTQRSSRKAKFMVDIFTTFGSKTILVGITESSHQKLIFGRIDSVPWAGPMQ